MNDNDTDCSIRRREFLGVTALGGSAFLASCAGGTKIEGLRLASGGTLKGLRQETGATPIADAAWYVAEAAGDGLSYRIPKGALTTAKYLTADMLLDGNHMIVFHLSLLEGEKGRRFTFRFSGLNQCSFRVRMPLSLVDQGRWGIDREGAFLKPRCSGQRVDLNQVDRMTLTVVRKSTKRARWCMSDFIAAPGEVEKLTTLVLPKGPLLDELGQSTLHAWPGKSKSVEEVTSRIRTQLEAAPNEKWPDSFLAGAAGKRNGLPREPASSALTTTESAGGWWTRTATPSGQRGWTASGWIPRPLIPAWNPP